MPPPTDGGKPSESLANLVTMICVRPTLRALGQLPEEGAATKQARAALERARKTPDRQARLQILSQLDLCALDGPLIQAAKQMVEGEKFDPHREASAAAGKSVFEVRSHAGAGWRGALVPIEDVHWLVFCDTHDAFHRRVAGQMATAKTWPTDLDRALLHRELRRAQVANERLRATTSVLDGLAAAVQAGSSTISVNVPGQNRAATLGMHILHEAVEESAGSIQTGESLLSISITGTPGSEGLNDLLLRISAFLQPDADQREQVYGWQGEFIISVVVTHAKLMQILAAGNISPGGPSPAANPEPPTKLHYLAKDHIARGVVLGSAEQALCGAWIVPSRDASADLPICQSCESLEPVAQLLVQVRRDLLR